MAQKQRYWKGEASEYGDDSPDRIPWIIDILPRQGVVKASPVERAIQRIVRGESYTEPGDDAQCDLHGDIMFSFYQSDTELKDKGKIPPERQVNAALVNWMLENPQFQQGKIASVANVAAALSASSLMWETLVQDKSLQEALKAQKEAEEKAKELEELIHQMRKGEAGGNAQQKMDDLKKQIKEAADKGTSAIDKLKQNPLAQGLMSNAAKQGSDRGQEVAAMMKAWGAEAGGQNPVDIQTALKMFKQNMEKMKRIAELTGKLKNASVDSIQKTRQSYTGPVNEVALVRDFMKLLPTERLAFSPLMPPLLRTNKVLQFVEHGLPGFKSKSEAKKKGSFRAMVDGSGSMMGNDETIAKAVALGVGYALHEDKEADRHYTLYTFGTEQDDFDTVSDKEGWQDHIRWASNMPGGGTDFNYAVLRGIKDIRESPYPGEDLLFITDGGARMRESTIQAWKQLKEEKGCKLLYIQIGNYSNEQVRELSDLFIQVTNLDDAAGEELAVKISEMIIETESGD